MIERFVRGQSVLQRFRAGALNPVTTESSPRIPVDDLLQRFLKHATDSRGLSAATCRAQGRYVREFLISQSSAGAVDVGRISARGLVSFVVARAESGRSGAARQAASTLRGFLRFLVQQGWCAEYLIHAIPSVTHRGAHLPRHLSDDQVTQLLTSFDRSQAIGSRDYAMTICMVRLGLRVGEVVGLRLEDIAWRTGSVRIGTSKARRAGTLPLPPDVGRAIAKYIREGRPETADRHVFVTHATPRGQQLSSNAARGAIRRAFDRARLSVRSKGTHVLRHTLATNMVCQGASLKVVADVLRHRSLDTTMVYARVDLPTLRSVAMPWPVVL